MYYALVRQLFFFPHFSVEVAHSRLSFSPASPVSPLRLQHVLPTSTPLITLLPLFFLSLIILAHSFSSVCFSSRFKPFPSSIPPSSSSHTLLLALYLLPLHSLFFSTLHITRFRAKQFHYDYNVYIKQKSLLQKYIGLVYYDDKEKGRKSTFIYNIDTHSKYKNNNLHFTSYRYLEIIHGKRKL